MPSSLTPEVLYVARFACAGIAAYFLLGIPLGIVPIDGFSLIAIPATAYVLFGSD